MRSLSHLYASLLLQCSLVIAYHEEITDKLFHGHSKVDLINEQRHYVPLGHHYAFPCVAFDKSEHLPIEKDKINWKIFKKEDGKVQEFPLPKNEKGWRFEYDSKGNFVLYGFALQRVHHDAVLECWVPSVRSPGDDKDVIFVSRIHISMQDCGTHDELKFKNLANPCQYGACQIEDNHGFERLSCLCVEQYSGLYCDKEVEGTFKREFYFYSPLIGHFAIFGVFLLINACYHNLHRTKRLSLEGQILDRTIEKHDLRILYPASYLSPEEINRIRTEQRAAKDALKVAESAADENIEE